LYGTIPDLEDHIQRLQRSAELLGLEPIMETEAIKSLCWRGVKFFPTYSQLYLRLVYFSKTGSGIIPNPESTEFALLIEAAPIPRRKEGAKLTISDYRRPDPRSGPTLAKAACLYPASAISLRDANKKGFDNAIMLDLDDNLAELCTANIFFVSNGVVCTPKENGTFLAGITRRRVINILAEKGIQFLEGSFTVSDLLKADEVFYTGNYEQIQPARQIDNRFFTGSEFSRSIAAWNIEYIKKIASYTRSNFE
jgi:branched-chain amino acid aminotransferase